jgi:hypothetical protein
MITKFNFIENNPIIKMSDMKHLDMATIVGDKHGVVTNYTGYKVVRRASEARIEFMLLTNPGRGKCFNLSHEFTVRLFKPGESVTLIQQ